MNDKTDWQATIIKILAVVTATPRWVGALLAAEGLVIPTAWADGWVIGSAIMSAAMAAVEGWAFSYVFEAWRNQEDAKSNRLGWLMLTAAVMFVVVLAPYIATSVNHKPLSETLSNGWALGAWAICVGGSTIAIVASVGYAQKHRGQRKAQPVAKQDAPKETTSAPVAKQEETDAQEVANPTKQERILEYHKAQPLATSSIIAQQVGASRQYVDKVLATRNGKTREPLTIGTNGKAG